MKATMADQVENKMGTAPVGGLIAGMAVPAMFSMLVQALYNIVDSFFVAKISEEALTAVSLAFPIQSLLIAFAVGTGVGINSLVSRRLGEGRKQEANSAATHGLLLGLVNWAIFALFGLLFSRQFIQGFSNDPTVIEEGARFVQIVCLFSFGVFIEINVERTLQATGRMIYPMIFQLIGALTSLILDPIFIFGWFGVPAMGVPGAAIANVIAQCIAMTVSLVVLFKQKHEVKIEFKGFRLDFHIIKDIYAVGIPTIIMQSIASVMVMGMNLILVRFTETAVALFGVYFKLQSFVFMPVFGLMQGVLPILGYNYGARKQERMTKAIRIGITVSAVIMAIGTVLLWVMPGRLLLIFKASPEMLHIGIPALRIISLCFIPAALDIMFSTVFQSLGKGIYSLALSLLRQLVILLPAAFLLSHLSLTAVWYSFPIAELGSLAAGIPLFIYVYRKMIQPLSTEGEKIPLPKMPVVEVRSER